MRPRTPRVREIEFWEGVAGGLGVERAATVVGVSGFKGRSLFREAGGVRPELRRQTLRLSFEERSLIEAMLAVGASQAAIAERLDRSPGTISREIARNSGSRGYHARSAQSRADVRSRRPQATKLSRSARLCAEVQTRLEEEHSPEQIAQRLREDFPEDPEMRVSHETIYKSLYVQGRGELRRDLTSPVADRASAAPPPAPRRPQRQRAGPDPGHGPHQRAARRGRGPGSAGSLGGRSDHGLAGIELRHRHPGRTRHQVRDAAAPARWATALTRSRRRCSRR